MEELRPCMADRFVLKLINDRIIQADDFVEQQSGAVELKDSARKRFLQEWQEKKHVVITHPYLREKIEWGLLPHVQALLLARYMRGDIDAYPPFLYK
jgi:CRISPR-associated protein Cas1